MTEQSPDPADQAGRSPIDPAPGRAQDHTRDHTRDRTRGQDAARNQARALPGEPCDANGTPLRVLLGESIGQTVNAINRHLLRERISPHWTRWLLHVTRAPLPGTYRSGLLVESLDRRPQSRYPTSYVRISPVAEDTLTAIAGFNGGWGYHTDADHALLGTVRSKRSLGIRFATDRPLQPHPENDPHHTSEDLWRWSVAAFEALWPET